MRSHSLPSLPPGLTLLGSRNLLVTFHPHQSTYKLQASAPVVWGRPFTSDELQALARRYVAGMKSVQPHGPLLSRGYVRGRPHRSTNDSPTGRRKEKR